MEKTIGFYTIKVNANTNLISIQKKGNMIFAETVKAADTGSRFNQLCEFAKTKLTE